MSRDVQQELQLPCRRVQTELLRMLADMRGHSAEDGAVKEDEGDVDDGFDWCWCFWC